VAWAAVASRRRRHTHRARVQARARFRIGLNEADTKAYLDAEEVLTEDQRAPAREVASEYREQLYERRANAVQAPP
jgi:hypothetical protein